MIEFARKLGVDLMPWQEYVLLHGLELLDDGTYRFETVNVTVSRQNGKTTVAKVLALWRMVEEKGTTVLGTSTNLEYARDAFEATTALAEDELPGEVQKVKRGGMETSLTLLNRSRYRIAAATRRAGRSLSVDLAILDELREHANWDAWGAASGATTARPMSQIWCFSNAGDDTSVVLNSHRQGCIAAIETGNQRTSMALFEWSAPEDCDLDAREAWCQANPALGHTLKERTLESKLASSPPAVFRTEHLCQRVASMDSAVDMAAWRDCADTSDMETVRDRAVMAVDVSLDGNHVTLVAAAAGDDGRVRVDVVESWDSVAAARRDLRNILDATNPRAVGWFDKGPASTLTPELRSFRNVVPIPQTEVATACQMLAEQIMARSILRYAGDTLMTSQLDGTARIWSNDGWRFQRRGVGQCDAVYALSAAVYLVRTLPKPARRFGDLGSKKAS